MCLTHSFRPMISLTLYSTTNPPSIGQPNSSASETSISAVVRREYIALYDLMGPIIQEEYFEG